MQVGWPMWNARKMSLRYLMMVFDADDDDDEVDNGDDDDDNSGRPV